MFPLFNTNKLENKGERIDIDMTKELVFDKLNLFQKIHLNRYVYVNSLIEKNTVNLDVACGTGYGTILLSEKSTSIEGYDIDGPVIAHIQKRYQNYHQVTFGVLNVLELQIQNKYDNIISFETLEHFDEADIITILNKYHSALKSGASLYFSTPYKQKNDWRMKILGHHKTFDIDEAKIKEWLTKTGFRLDFIKYQNYTNFLVEDTINDSDILICKAIKA